MKTKEVIYMAVVFTELLLLATGVDYWYGEEVRNFCKILLPIWIIGLGVRNWKQIKEFSLKVLFNLKGKK
jgi:hypothetical protein